MTGRPDGARRRILPPGRLARVAALTTCAAATGVPAVLAAAVAPARDSFTGSIIGATGRFAGERGAVALVTVPAAGQGVRPLKLTLRGSGCTAGSRRCVELTGSLSGTLALGPVRVPDVGSRLTIAASGRIKPIGLVSATGTVQGTGFIARGRETLDLRLRAPRGTITVRAVSARVPGFTSP